MLLTQVDVLLLDEPTNDLDADGLALLESFLDGRDGGLVVVSHDRAFLERVATAVLEIDEFTRAGHGVRRRLRGLPRGARAGPGRRARRPTRPTTSSAARLVDRARREKEWARQGQARATSAKARADEPDKNVRAAKLAGAQSRSAAAGRLVRAA